MLAAEQAKVESDEDSDESDAVVYDYAEEDAVNAISKRPVKSKEDIHKNGKKITSILFILMRNWD